MFLRWENRWNSTTSLAKIVEAFWCDVTEDLESVHNLIPDETYQQIIKDVARSHGQIPEKSSEEEVETFEKDST